MQQISRVDVISKLNGTICRLEDSVDSLRAELHKLRRGNTDIRSIYCKHNLDAVIENNEDLNKIKQSAKMDNPDECINNNISEHDISNTNSNHNIVEISEDMNTVKEDGDILISNESSKKPLKKVKESKTKCPDIEPVVREDNINLKKFKKRSKYHKMKPLINFNETNARKRLHSIKDRIIALTQELPSIENQIIQESEVQNICEDKKRRHAVTSYQQYRHTNKSQPCSNDNQIYYKYPQRPDSSTTWREQKNKIRDRLKAGSYTLNFKGANLSKISGYGESLRK